MFYILFVIFLGIIAFKGIEMGVNGLIKGEVSVTRLDEIIPHRTSSHIIKGRFAKIYASFHGIVGIFAGIFFLIAIKLLLEGNRAEFPYGYFNLCVGFVFLIMLPILTFLASKNRESYWF